MLLTCILSVGTNVTAVASNASDREEHDPCGAFQRQHDREQQRREQQPRERGAGREPLHDVQVQRRKHGQDEAEALFRVKHARQHRAIVGITEQVAAVKPLNRTVDAPEADDDGDPAEDDAPDPGVG